MQIEVVYTTQVKAALGLAGESVDAPEGCTLGALVELLAQRHSETFREVVLTDSGKLLPSIILCIGDEQVAIEDPRKLADGETVTLLSAISGG